MKRTDVLGAVLAGGRSLRYGRPKAMETVGGIPMVERAVHALESACERVVVVSSRPIPGLNGCEVIPDLTPGAGPLGGLEAALARAGDEGCPGVLLLACDLPLVTSDTVASVLRGRRDALAVAPGREGHPAVEPLCAYYAVSCLDVVRDHLEAGERALHRLFAAVGGRAVSLEGDVFVNVNTPEDRLLAESRAGESRRMPSG